MNASIHNADGYPPLRNAHGQATTLPMAPMQRQPTHPPPMQLAQAPMHQHPAHMEPMPGMMPTTIPGQGPPMHPSQQQMQQLPYGYPNINDLPQHALLVQSQNLPRNDVSTMHVQPIAFNHSGAAVAVPVGYRPPGISLRTKLLLGGAGLTILAAVATIAIIKGTSSSDESETASASDSETPSTPREPEVTPLPDPPKDKKNPDNVAVEPGKKDPKETKVEPKIEPKVEPIKPTLVLDAKLSHERREIRPNALVEALEATRQDDLKKEEDAKKKEEAQKKEEEAKREDAAKREREKAELAKRDKDKEDAAKREREKAELAKKEEARRAELAKLEAAKKNEPKKEEPRKEEPKKEEPKKVATASTTELTEARARADGLYRERRFKEAAQSLRVKASALSGGAQQQLASRAGLYESFGAAYNIGMGQGTSPKDAYRALNSALAFDGQIGGAYTAEIRTQLGQVAPKAAVAFLSTKDYQSAAAALRLADSLGTGSAPSAALARKQLESRAQELYREAERLADSDPAGARLRVAQINTIVGEASPWRQKAKALKIGP
ncbi:MAG: hypothetical protein KIT31_00275 [Deltaproteobacteria bacterium]|nr:hypothetical protein [Deltaproteobacteria bacterium]